MYREGITGSADLGLLDLTSRRARALVGTPFNEQNGEVSPDGRWIAYESTESGQDEIYVRPFPDVQKGRWQVSTGGGVQPVWSRNGRELFYRGPQRLMAVPVQAAGSFMAGAPQPLFETSSYWLGPVGRAYDVSPDGKRFLMIKQAGATGGAQFIVIENWFDELRARVR